MRKSAEEVAAVVAALFAKADDPAATGPEREAFLAKATEMMVEYEIDSLVLDAGKNGEVPIVFGQFRLYAKGDNLVPDERMVLTGAIARNFECKGVVHRLNYPSISESGSPIQPGTFYELIGYQHDVEMVMALYFNLSLHMLTSIMVKVQQVQQASKTKIKASDLTNYQREFAQEYVSIMDRRLQQQYGRIKSWTPEDGMSESVGLAIRSRLEKVQDKFNEKYPPGSLSNVRTKSSRYDHNARAAGRAAANSADLGTGNRIGGSGSAGQIGSEKRGLGRGES